MSDSTGRKHTIGLVLAGTAVFSFLFAFRQPLLIKPSKYADYWELCGVLLVFANASIITFFGYDGSPPPYGSLELDIPMHIWGGIFAGFWAELAFDAQFSTDSRLKKTLIILGIVALIGIVWELFEWTEDRSFGLWLHLPVAQSSLNDTMGDLFNDFIGGIAVIIALSKWKLASSADSITVKS